MSEHYERVIKAMEDDSKNWMDFHSAYYRGMIHGLSEASVLERGETKKLLKELERMNDYGKKTNRSQIRCNNSSKLRAEENAGLSR